MTPPEIYYEWAQILNLVKAATDDAETFEAIQRGTIVHQPGVYERLVNHIIDVMSVRLERALKSFHDTVSHANSGSLEMVVSQALGTLSKEINTISKLAILPALKKEEQKKLIDIVKNETNKIEETLMKSAKADRSGKLTSILKSKPFNHFEGDKKEEE